MQIGQTVRLFRFVSQIDKVGQSFNATIMMIDQADGVVTVKEPGKEPIVCTTMWLVQSMAYRKMHDTSLLIGAV